VRVDHPPRPLELSVGPAHYDPQIEFANIDADHNLLAWSLLTQRVGINVIDTNASVCFPSHGDDLLHAVAQLLGVVLFTAFLRHPLYPSL
jgi:hypothetical protein